MKDAKGYNAKCAQGHARDQIWHSDIPQSRVRPDPEHEWVKHRVPDHLRKLDVTEKQDNPTTSRNREDSNQVLSFGKFMEGFDAYQSGGIFGRIEVIFKSTFSFFLTIIKWIQAKKLEC